MHISDCCIIVLHHIQFESLSYVFFMQLIIVHKTSQMAISVFQ